MGQNVIQQNVIGQMVVGQNVMGQNVIGQNVIGQNVIGQNVIGQNVIGPNVIGQNVMGQNVIGQIVVGQIVGRTRENFKPYIVQVHPCLPLRDDGGFYCSDWLNRFGRLSACFSLTDRCQKVMRLRTML
jgi:hypothetical protein